MEQPFEPKRVALVLIVFSANLLLTGLIYGWAPLLLMLQDEGQYVEVCGRNTTQIGNDSGFVCIKQENKLNLIFAVASVVLNAASLPVGMLADFAGPAKAATLAAVVELGGLILMAFADSQTFDVFLPAYSMLALGGSITMMTSYPASFVIMKYQTAILATVNCLFDGSSVVFLVLYSMQTALKTTRQQLFIGLALVAGVIYLLLVLFWLVNESVLTNGISSSTSEADKDIFADAIDTPVETPNVAYNASFDDPVIDNSTAKELQLELDSLQLVDESIRKQLLSIEFVFIVIFATIQMLCATIYIGTTNKHLENNGDSDHDYLYTKVFSGVLPLGFLFVPVINYVVEKEGLISSLLVTNGLGVAYNSLALIPNLPIQCLAFILFTGFRSFLYTILSVYVAKLFGLKNLGTLMGFNFFIGAIVNLLEYPAVFISNKYLDGSLAGVYAFTLFLCTSLIPITLHLRAYELAKESRRNELLSLLSSVRTS